ncbi:hypothetical protein [Ruania alba]|nr:hypothetical protein [Ruania alba]
MDDSGASLTGLRQWEIQSGLREVVGNSAADQGVPSVDIGLPVPEDDSEFVFDGPDGLCMATDYVAPVANLVPCDDRPVDEEAPEAPEDPEEEADEPEPVIITVSESDFAELPLAPAEFGVQPDPADGAWTVVNMDTIAYASDDPQVVSTQVLGFPVAVRASPVEFAWDFGDGSDPLVTTDPGAPYPDHTVAYAYAQPVEETRVSLTTTWVGEFQVGGQGPWIPIAGTAQTTSESAAFEVVEVTTRLVPGPQANG